MKHAWFIIPILALLAALFLPLVTIRGPIVGEYGIAIADLVGGESSGKDSRPSASELPGVEHAKRELSSLRIPLTGPVIMGVSFVFLLALYALLPFATYRGYRHGRVGALYCSAMSSGVLFGILFLIGAALTQKALNEVEGASVTQKIAALFSKVAAELYAIRMGSAGWLVSGVCLLFLVAALVRSRSASTGGGTAPPAAAG